MFYVLLSWYELGYDMHWYEFGYVLLSWYELGYDVCYPDVMWCMLSWYELGYNVLLSWTYDVLFNLI
jgi:hypothetical protein